MTDDDLRAFAEEMANGAIFGYGQHHFREALAKRFLELLPPADDGEPATSDWLLATGFRFVKRWSAWAIEVSEQVDVAVTGGGKMFVVHGNQSGAHFVWFPRTGCNRGDVRRVVAALTTLGTRPAPTIPVAAPAPPG